MMLKFIQSEPAMLWAGLVAAAFNAAIVFAPSFGLKLTPEEQAAAAVVVNAVISLIVRSQVAPVASPKNPNAS